MDQTIRYKLSNGDLRINGHSFPKRLLNLLILGKQIVDEPDRSLESDGIPRATLRR